MRSVYALSAVMVLGLIAHIIFAAGFPLDHPVAIFDGFTVAHAFLIWWLYIAPLFVLAAFALLIWKSWMETLPRLDKMGGWVAVVVAAGLNALMAFEILNGRL